MTAAERKLKAAQAAWERDTPEGRAARERAEKQVCEAYNSYQPRALASCRLCAWERAVWDSWGW